MSRARDVASRDIVDGSVGTNDLADSSVTSIKIANGTIVDADVSASAAIAATKLSGVVAQSLVDAKGDLLAGTANDTVGRLPVGTNGQILSANSSTSTGLEWTTLNVNSMTQLATATANNTVQTYTFSGLPTTYKRLIVVGIRTASGNNAGSIFVQVNPSTANHDYHATGVNGTTITAVSQTSDSGFRYTDLFNASAQADANAGSFVLVIDDANGTSHKPVHGYGYCITGGVGRSVSIVGRLNMSAAVTEIRVSQTAASNIRIGTFYVYGVN